MECMIVQYVKISLFGYYIRSSTAVKAVSKIGLR